MALSSPCSSRDLFFTIILVYVVYINLYILYIYIDRYLVIIITIYRHFIYIYDHVNSDGDRGTGVVGIYLYIVLYTKLHAKVGVRTVCISWVVHAGQPPTVPVGCSYTHRLQQIIKKNEIYKQKSIKKNTQPHSRYLPNIGIIIFIIL